MTIRADVAELLLAGLPDSTIARELGVDADKTVRRTREALGLPKTRRGRRAADSVDDLYWRRTQPVDDGHLIWTGYRSSSDDGRCPLVRHGGRIHSAYRIAFRLQYGREPEGHVTRTCDRDGCVAPAHTEDRVVRERTKATFKAIFGEVTSR